MKKLLWLLLALNAFLMGCSIYSNLAIFSRWSNWYAFLQDRNITLDESEYAKADYWRKSLTAPNQIVISGTLLNLGGICFLLVNCGNRKEKL